MVMVLIVDDLYKMCDAVVGVGVDGGFVVGVDIGTQGDWTVCDP